LQLVARMQLFGTQIGIPTNKTARHPLHRRYIHIQGLLGLDQKLPHLTHFLHGMK
jgi:hypothetical protein